MLTRSLQKLSLPAGGCRYPWAGAAALSVSLAAPLAWAQAGAVHELGPTPERYELRPLQRASVVDDMQRCVGPQVSSSDLQGFVAQALTALADDAVRATQLADLRGQAVVLAVAGRWACVALSDEGFPLWPVETLQGLIVPVGVPADLTQAWRRQLLAQVARDGVGRGLIVYPSGDADQVLVIAEQRQALRVKFSTRLLSAGNWQEQHYSAVLRHAGLTRLVTRSSSAGPGTPSRLAIPPHRLLKPVQDGFVVLPANEATRHFAFAGTRWELPTAAGPHTLVLQADGSVASHAAAAPPAGVRSAVQGRAAARPETRATLSVAPVAPIGDQPDTLRGRWHVTQGVLRLALSDGAHYALTVADDPHTLAGVARRVEAAEADDEGSEWQWPAQLRRAGAPAPHVPHHLQQVRLPAATEFAVQSVS